MTFKCAKDGSSVADSQCVENKPKRRTESCESYRGCEGFWVPKTTCETPEKNAVRCGAGTKSTEYQCVKRGSPNDVLSPEDCGPEPVEAIISAPCIVVNNCEGKWQKVQSCRTTCGEGVATIDFKCVDDFGNPVDISKCGGEATKPEPQSPEPCKPTPSCEPFDHGGFYWASKGGQGTCRPACGTTWKRSERVCKDRNDNDRVVSAQKCIEAGLNKEGDRYLETLATAEECKPIKSMCEIVTEYPEQCSVGCGDGYLDANFKCRDKKTRVVTSLEDCIGAGLSTPSTPPIPCVGTSCESFCDFCNWETQDEITCEAACGESIKAKELKCVSRIGFFDNSRCGRKAEPARIVTECRSTDTCPPSWDYCCDGTTVKDAVCSVGTGMELSADYGLCGPMPVCTGTDTDPSCAPSNLTGILAVIIGCVVVTVVLISIGVGTYCFFWCRRRSRRLNVLAKDDIASSFKIQPKNNNNDGNISASSSSMMAMSRTPSNPSVVSMPNNSIASYPKRMPPGGGSTPTPPSYGRWTGNGSYGAGYGDPPYSPQNSRVDYTNLQEARRY